jgi:hypothetical protein
LASLLQGALAEGALYIAQAEDPAAAGRRIDRELKLVLEGLFA